MNQSLLLRRSTLFAEECFGAKIYQAPFTLNSNFLFDLPF